MPTAARPIGSKGNRSLGSTPSNGFEPSRISPFSGPWMSGPWPNGPSRISSRGCSAGSSDYLLAETAGTLGRPKTAVHRADEFETAFVTPFVMAARRVGFPEGGHWLFIGPTGPHIIGRAARRCARALGAARCVHGGFRPPLGQEAPSRQFRRPAIPDAHSGPGSGGSRCPEHRGSFRDARGSERLDGKNRRGQARGHSRDSPRWHGGLGRVHGDVRRTCFRTR